MARPEICRYLKSHEWASMDGGTATVGISDYAQKEITDVVFVDPPKVGRKLKQGEVCGAVESVKAAFDLYAPLSGEVTAVNEAAVKDPSLINQSAHDKGWLYKIKVDDVSEADSLMDYAAYQTFLKAAASHPNAGH